MTPEVLSFNGMCWVSPPVIRVAETWRFGYWISTLRCARSTKTMPAITTNAITRKPTMTKAGSAPVLPSSRVWANAAGMPATMPAKMIREMPLPMPRWVICSPSHIRNIVPPTRVTVVTPRKNRPGSITGEMPPPVAMFSRPVAMP